MKKTVKLLLALLLAVMCVFSYAACVMGPGTGGEVVPPDEDEKEPDTDDSTGDNADDTVEVEGYKLSFYYSYTTKIKNAYDRNETVKQKNNVHTLVVPYSNTGLTQQHLDEINNILYHGYGFAEWYDEDDWVIGDKADTQHPATGADPHSFKVGDTISSDMSFYGVKGDLAGRNAHWSVTRENYTDANGKPQVDVILTISGEGPMFDYEIADVISVIDIPWYTSASEVTTIIIDDRITYIGKNAFNGFSSVSTVVMNGVEEIGEYAFKGLAKLKTFVAPEGLKTIGRNAFESTGLTSVYLNEGLTSIPQYAFFASKNISSLLLPSTITSIGQGAFHPGIGLSASRHSLKYVYFSGRFADGRNAFSGIDIATDNESLTEFPTIYYLLDDVFTLSIMEYVSPIGGLDGQFDIVNNLDGNGEIGGTYYYKNNSGTFAIYRDSQSQVPCDDFSITVSGGKYFIECPELGSQSVAFEDITPSNSATKLYAVKYSEDYGIKGPYWGHFTTRENMTIPMQHCLTIKYYLPGENYVAWIDYVIATPTRSKNNKGVISYSPVGYLDSENIQYRIDNIKYHGFKFATYGDEGEYYDEDENSCDFSIGAKMVADIRCDLGRGKILSENGGVVFSTSGGTVTVSLDKNAIEQLGGSDRIWDFDSPLDTQVLWTGAISGLTNIQKLVIKEGITYIGSNAFNGLLNITEVVIPASVKGISSNAFSGCSKLVSIYYSGDLADCSVYDTSGKITNKTLADRDVLSGIGSTKFYSKCNPDEPVADGSYWKDIDGKYIAWTLDKRAGTLYIGGDAVMMDFKSETATPWYGAEVLASVHTVEFANNITKLGEYVIHGYRNVQSIVLPADLTEIPESSLSATGLLLDKSSYNLGVLVINNHLIKVDSAIKNTEFFDIVYMTRTIAGGAFDGCDKIREMYIPLTVRYIHPNALRGVENLKIIYTDATADGWKSISANSCVKEYVNVYTVGYWDTKEYVPLFGCNNNDCTHDGICKHEWGDWYIKQMPTHTVNGIRARPCLVEGCYYEQTDREHEDVLKKNQKVGGDYVHDYGDYVLDHVTHCVTDITETATCKYCDATTTREVKGTMIGFHALGDGVEDNNATCTSTGTITFVCTNEYCDYSETKTDINQPPLPHTPASELVLSDVKTESSACGPHYVYYLYCTACNAKMEEYTVTVENKNVAPHSWGEFASGEYIYLRATATTSNVYYKSCSVCGISSENVTDNVAFPTDADKLFTKYGSHLNYYGWDETILEEIISSAENIALENNMDSEYVYAATVLKNGGKVLNIGKNSGAAHAVVNVLNSYKDESNYEFLVHVLETKMIIGEYVGTADYIYRIGLNTEEKAFFNLYFTPAKDDADGNKQVDIKTSLGKDAEVLATVKLGELFDLSIIYKDIILSEIVSDDDHPDVTIVKYYHNVEVTVNGERKTVRAYLDISDIAVDPEAEEIVIRDELVGGTPLYRFAYVSNELGESISEADVYLDNTYVATYTNDVWSKPTNNDPDPDFIVPGTSDGELASPDYVFVEDKTDEDGVVENPVEGVTVKVKDGAKNEDGTYKYVHSEVVGGALVVNTWKNEKGNAFATHTAFTVPTNRFEQAVNSTYVFEAILNIGEGTHRLTFTNAIASLHSVAFDVTVTTVIENDKEVKKLVIKDAYSGLDGKSDTFEVVLIDGEFSLRIELYSFTVDGSARRMSKIYVNNEYIGSSDCATVVNGKVASYDIESVVVYHKVDTNTNISFKDVILSNEILGLDGESFTTDFGGNLTEEDGLVEKPADKVTISSSEGDNLTKHDYVLSEIRDGELLVTNKGNSYTGTTAFSLPGNVGKYQSMMFAFSGTLTIIEGYHRLAFTNGDGSVTGFAIDLAINEDGALVISDSYNGLDKELGDDIVVKGIGDDQFSISVVLYSYEINGGVAMLADVFVNGEYCATTDSYNNSSCDIEAVTFTHGADSQMAFDEVTVSESYTNAVYVPTK